MGAREKKVHTTRRLSCERSAPPMTKSLAEASNELSLGTNGVCENLDTSSGHAGFGTGLEFSAEIRHECGRYRGDQGR